MAERETCSLDDKLARARAGDPAAFASLLRAHQKSVYSLALRMVGDREVAEDLAQEVFLQLHRSLAGIESAVHLQFWLRRVTAHRAIDCIRHEPRVPAASLDDPDAVHLAYPEPANPHDPLLVRHLRSLLGELAPAARAVLLLRYQEDLDPADIAKTLEMPLNTVKSHLKRSLGVLREKMTAAVHGHDDPVANGVREHR